MDLNSIKRILSTSIKPRVVSDGHRLAAVLVVIYGRNPTVVLTKKPKHLKFHAGEISFPGGKLEDGDLDLLDTAIRETSEEIGLKLTREQIIGQLKPVTTLNSGFLILPFVSILDDVPFLRPNHEVEEIFRIPLESLLKTMRHDDHPEHQAIKEMYVFKYGDHVIWGATARMLKQISDRLYDRKAL